MKSQEILKKFINFYEDRGHKVIENASLIPKNDPTLLYVNSGMFPLVPYLSGEPHPKGKRLVNVQRALRFFEDLENIGNTIRHTTCFHMLGNWSLGDYFKEEQLNWVFELLVDNLGFDVNRIYASIFKGDEDAPKDTDALRILQNIYSRYGIEAKENERIFAYGKKENWWQRGDAIGELGGPDSELFYYLGDDNNEKKLDPATHDDLFLEIGNSVFMQYKKTVEGWKELTQKNIDFGGGLERWALILQGKKDIYETDNFWPIIQKIEEITKLKYTQDELTKKSMRVIADHMRAATLLAMDGVYPSNKDQGYILRRLIRRMVKYGMNLNITENITPQLVETTGSMLDWIYPELKTKTNQISKIFYEEESKFLKSLHGSKHKVYQILKNTELDIEALALEGFNLYQSSGYPIELFLDKCKEMYPNLDEGLFDKFYKDLFKKHQETSRKGAKQKFAGGLADHSEQTTKYHTATHLLHWALRFMFGDQIVQMGSNITSKRLRFDFNFDRKLSETEIAQLEFLINEKIKESLKVGFEIMPKEDALKIGAIHAFDEKYTDEVKIYYIGNNIKDAISKEFCGGPHVKNTSEIGEIKFLKQKKVGANLLRLYLH